MSLRYVVNEQGQPIQVLLDIAEYEKLLERIAEAEAVRMVEGMKTSAVDQHSYDELTTKPRLH